MLTWLAVNLALSLLALVFIKLNSTAPPRLRFFAGFAAMMAWLVPWQLLPDLLPTNLFSVELWPIERAVEAGSERLTGIVPLTVEARAMPLAREFVVFSALELGFIALTLLGCVSFAWTLAAHRLWLRRLATQCGEDNWLWARAGLAPVCPVSVQREIVGAFSSGLLHPRIWVHGDLVHAPQLATVLRHEAMHIRQHDNWYLLAITLVERLLWWNPLVWYLGRDTRELQELSCDERCQRANADYPAELAQLMIESAREPRMLALSANIFSKPNPNVKRIKLLQKAYPMLTRHILAAAVTAASAVLAVGFVTAQPEEEQAGAAERVRVFSLERAPGAVAGVRLVTDALPALPGSASGMNDRGFASDLFVRIDAVNGERTLDLSLSDTPLPRVLMPLVNMINAGGAEFAGVAVVRRLDGGAEAVTELSTRQLIEAQVAAGGAARWGEAWRLVSFRPRMVENEKLLLEFAEAANRTVSVTGTNLSIDEAIALIAEASGCNIFQDGDTIVVDYCDG